MPKVTYDGRYAAVDVPALGLRGVERGQTVEVGDDAAKTLRAAGWTVEADTKAAPKVAADKGADAPGDKGDK